MNRVTTEKCMCGHPSCRDVWLVGIGKFVQGSGFTQEEADLVISSLRSRKILEDMEWSGTRRGQGFGPHGSGGGGHPYAACPECGGLEEKNGEFVNSAVGHRSGCTIADVLGRKTVIEEGENGSLPL